MIAVENGLPFLGSYADAEIPHRKEKRSEFNARVRDETLACIALARKAGVPVVLVTQTNCVDGPGGTKVLKDTGLDAIVAPMLGEGVYKVSMQDLFSTQPDLKQFFVDTQHLRPPGHELLAKGIIAELQKQKVIAPRLAGP